jgi:hypothetical protein
VRSASESVVSQVPLAWIYLTGCTNISQLPGFSASPYICCFFLSRRDWLAAGNKPPAVGRCIGMLQRCCGWRLMGQSAAGRGCLQKAGCNTTELVIPGLVERAQTGRFHGLSV